MDIWEGVVFGGLRAGHPCLGSCEGRCVELVWPCAGWKRFFTHMDSLDWEGLGRQATELTAL